MSGTLIVFEGIDGVGKSTQILRLSERLKGLGHAVVLSREPTDGPFGRRIREAAAQGVRLDREEELSLFIQDRQHHVETLIKPGLAAGKVILLDRYYFSTAAYQGASGYDVQELLARNEAFAPAPDVLLILDQEPALSLERVGQRGAVDAFEALEPLTACRAIFQKIAEARAYATTIDASQAIDDVQDAVWAALPSGLRE